jgi:uncharacterized Rmd1/YagE family protein
MSESNSSKKCTTVCLAQRFDINTLSKLLSETSLIRIIKGTIFIEDEQSWSVIFAFGAVVHWNISPEQQGKLHVFLLEHAENPLVTPEEDHFSFELSCASTRMNEDHIEIESTDPMVIFALSQGMAQSIKLSSFEAHAVTTINNTNYIPKSLAETGRIRLSSNKIAKIRGQLFLTKSDIILNYDLLDTPDFFWEYPEYEIFYGITAKYLEINQRTKVLSKKLKTIHELFEMLADEQKHRHSSILEMVIIYMIGIEILLSIIDTFF